MARLIHIVQLLDHMHSLVNQDLIIGFGMRYQELHQRVYRKVQEKGKKQLSFE